MICVDDLTREIRQVLKKEAYGLEASQIVDRLGRKTTPQKVSHRCGKDPLVVEMDGFKHRYRLMTKIEYEMCGRELDDLLNDRKGGVECESG